MSTPSATAYPDLRLDRSPADPLRDITIDFNRIGAFLRRHVRLLVICMLIGAGGGLVASIVQTKQYTASTRVLYGTVKGQAAEDQTTLEPGIGDTSVDAQVELIKSDAIMRSVINMLNLTVDPRLQAEIMHPSWLARLTGSKSPTPDEAAIADAISRKLKVERIGRSQILAISFTASDASLSADIANAVGQAYVDEQLNANADLARSTSQWLTEQITDLRGQVDAKDKAIQRFRAEHNLVGPDGQSIGNQQLAELNIQMVSAQSELAAAKARRDALTSIARTNPANAVPLLGSNATIAALQQRLLDVQARYIHLQARLGSTHRLVQRLADDVDALKRALDEEARRAVASIDNDVKMAAARVVALQANLSALIGTIQDTDVASSQLAQMQVEADALRKAYQTSLDRYQQSQQSQSYPVASARVISAAEIPDRATSASRGRLILIGIGFGLVGGLLLGLLFDWRRRAPEAAVEEVATP